MFRMVFFGIRVAMVMCLFLCLEGVVSAQSRITGQVFGDGRRPLDNVYVELLNELDSPITRTKTDGSGRYFFSGLSSGRFSVRVRPFGTDYQEQTQEVEITTFVAGRQVADFQQRDFYLKTRKGAMRKPGAPGIVFAQEVPKAAKEAYDRAISNIDSGRLELGLADLKDALSLFPTYFLALDRLGSELMKQQQWSDAQTFFQRAIDVNEKSASSWYGLAFCTLATNDVAKSIEAAKKAGVLSPDSSEPQLLLGIAQRRNKQYIDAEKSMLKAKKISDGKSADVFWNLALLYAHNLKNYRLAAIELEAYLKLKPDHPESEKLRKLISQWRTMT